MTLSYSRAKNKHAPNATLSDSARRQLYILRCLSQKDACLLWKIAEPSLAGTKRCDSITLVKSRKSVSLAAGMLTVAQFQALQSQDFITLAARNSADEHQSKIRRYVLSSAGEAFLARIDTDIQDHAFLAQHHSLAHQQAPSQTPSQTPPHKNEAILVNQKESPLAWLARRRDGKGKALLSAAQFLAGERLRQDLTFAQMLPSVTSNWSEVGGGRSQNGQRMTYSDRAIAARQRVNRALAAVGQEFSGILLDVCGFLKGLDLIEREHGWPQRSAKLVLSMALARLACYYGFAEETQGKTHQRATKLSHWGSEDYRPALEGFAE